MSTVLIIDDDPQIANVLGSGFRSLNVDVLSAGTAAEGLNQVLSHHPDVILLDVGLPDQSGLKLYLDIAKHDARVPIIVMTGQGTTETAIEAMKLGAFDYVLKPFTFTRIRDLANKAFEVARLMRVPVRMHSNSESDDSGADVMVGRCESMQHVYKTIGRVAQLKETVLIRGESGTGKELVARAIYQHSSRSEAPFIAINCAAIPETLLESELFGHEKGAFTDAHERRIGKFEQCSGGTLFLDEIGDMKPQTQPKLLRVLQDQRFQRVGGNQTIQTDTRLIVATHQPLEEMVRDGTFRQDLYYRLNTFTINLPPLRERTADMPLLVSTFLKRFSHSMGRNVLEASPEALEYLTNYSWPGNMRELQSVLKQALLQSVGTVLVPTFLPDYITGAGKPPVLTPPATPPPAAPPVDQSPELDSADPTYRFIEDRLQAGSEDLYAEWLARTERQLLVQVLRHTHGNQLRAAKILGITRRNLRGKIASHGIAIEKSVSTDNKKPE